MRILDRYGNPYPVEGSALTGLDGFVAQLRENPERVRKIMIELDQHTRALTKKDIGRWRRAHQAAIDYENPKRTDLLAIYADAELDNHLTGCVGQINNMVLGRMFKVIDRRSKQEREELTELFHSEWFKELVTYDLESFTWGHSLPQLGNVITVRGKKQLDGVELIPREHVCPEYGVILRDPSDDVAQGIPYRDDPRIYDWLIECGRKNDLGLYLKVSPHTISKKNMAAFWDTFGEIYGIPIRIAKTTSTNEAEQQRITDMLAQMGAAAYGLFPEGTSIEIKDGNQSDSYNVFDKRIDRCNNEISKCVLLQTMTIEDGSSLSQSQTHLEIFKQVIESRAEHVRDMVNNKLIPRLQKLGFPFTDNDVFEWEHVEERTAEEQLLIEQMILNRYTVDPKYFVDKYNIPITGEVTQPLLPTATAMSVVEKKKPALSDRVTALYGADPMQATAEGGTPDPDLDKLLRRLRRGANTDFDPGTFELNASQLQAAVAEGTGLDWSSVTLGTPDYDLLDHLEGNVYQFAAVKNYQQMRELTDALTDEAGNPRPFSEVQEAARRIDRMYNVDYLRTERDTAVSSAMTARDWQGYQRNKDTLPMLRYVTAGDRRVRPSHAALDGVVRPIDDDFWKTYYPPNGFGCRCTTQQTAGAPTGLDRIETPYVDPLFRTNLAETGLIFPKNHPYYDGVPKAVMRKAVAYLPPENTYRTVKVGEGARTIDVHPLHGADELADNAVIARILLENGSKEIRLLPVIHEKDAALKKRFYPEGYRCDLRKNADAVVDGEVFDFKLSGRRNLHHRIVDASRQADNVVVKLREDIAEHTLKGVCLQVKRECSIRRIIIIRPDNSVVSY
ncbi:MAG: DUF935 family protein [Rikenellaceae bacterium]|nr:DUF935 family protein [Rikenellaceae bacterium]